MNLLILSATLIVATLTARAGENATGKKGYDALFKSILVKADKYDRTLLESIADGGAVKVTLIGKKETAGFKGMSDADWKSFVDSNFRNHAKLVKLIDQLGLDYASRKVTDLPVFLDRKDSKKGGDGTLITFKLIMPKTADPALDPELKPAYRTVRFLEYNGKTYWLPFGW